MNLRILQWNVAMTPNPPPHISTRQAKERAPGIADLIRQYDIIILNESFLYRKYLLCLLPEYYSYTEPKIWYKFFNSGVVILSKLPLQNLTFKHYSKASNWDWFVSKGLLGATFQYHGKYYDIYGTHLQAGNSANDHDSRYVQTMEIVQQIGKTHNPSHSLILCGDFNCGPVYDSTFAKYSGHYSSKEDAIERNKQYMNMVNGTDTVPLIEYNGEDDISSFLFKRGEENTAIVKRISVTSSLSDTGPLAIEITEN